MSNSRQKESRYLMIAERELQERMKGMEQYINLESIAQFKGGIKRMCATFACPHQLTLIESLAGDRCTACMNTKPINITSTIKKP